MRRDDLIYRVAEEDGHIELQNDRRRGEYYAQHEQEPVFCDARKQLFEDLRAVDAFSGFIFCLHAPSPPFS